MIDMEGYNSGKHNDIFAVNDMLQMLLSQK